MNYPTIKTVEDLRAFMAEVKGEAVDNAQLFWFVCMYNAALIGDSYSRKDIAAMLLGGVKATDSLQDVQDFIDTFYEDGPDEYNQLQSLYIVKFVFNFFSKGVKEEEVQIQIGDLEDAE